MITLILSKKTFTKRKKENGFTLIELLLVIAITGLILSAIFTTFSSGINSFFQVDEEISVQKDIRFFINYVTKNVQNTSSIELGSKEPDSGEAAIYIENSLLKYKEYGGSERNIIEIPEDSTVSFDVETGGNLSSLIININGSQESKIILNNCSSSAITDKTSGSSDESIIFDI